MHAFLAARPVQLRSRYPCPNILETRVRTRSAGVHLHATRRVCMPEFRAALEPLTLSEAAVEQALQEVVVKLGSVFGNSEENRSVGITGEVSLAFLDGPIVVLRLNGRFWHKRSDVVRSPKDLIRDRMRTCVLEMILTGKSIERTVQLVF